MQFSKKIKMISSFCFIFLLLFNIGYSLDMGITTEGNIQSHTEESYEEINKELIVNQDPLSRAFLTGMAPATVPAGSLFVRINETLEFAITLTVLIVLVGILLGSQYIFIRLWIKLIKFVLKGYMILKIIGSDEKDIPDLIELLSKEGKQVSKSIRNKLNKTSETTVRLFTKITAILPFI